MRVGLALLLVWYGWQTAQYVPVFRSDVTLWAHAVEFAPQKPRVLTNYAGTLLMQGQVQRGVDVLVAADRAARASHVPEWDRVKTQETVRRNLAALLEVGQ